MDRAWIEQLLAEPELCVMGHAQRPEAADIGLGWLYHALARIERPQHVVCIGSWRGFVPLVLGRTLQDMGEGGQLTFIDPSLVDDHWRDADRVRAWFARFGVHNVQHHRMTTQQFVASAHFAELAPVGLHFIDGMHTAEQARFDHESFMPKLLPGAPVLFHDGVRHRHSRIYGADKPYEHTVFEYLDALRREGRHELLSFAQDSGVVLVRERARPAS